MRDELSTIFNNNGGRKMGKTNIKISVLIPVYNSELYLDELMGAILNQTFDEYEVILVNDGSNDGSANILERYERENENVRVIHCENSGAAAARNTALMYARGEYVAFVDSDDLIREDYLQKLYVVAVERESDIVVSSYCILYSDKNQYGFYNFETEYVREFTPEQAYRQYYKPECAYNFLFAVPWGKIIRKSLMGKINFPKGKFFEDAFIMYKLFFCANKIVCINDPIYILREHEGSLSQHKWTRERIKDNIEQHEERFAILAALGIEVTQEHRSDYIASLMICRDEALKNGFIEEYNRIEQKLFVIENFR